MTDIVVRLRAAAIHLGASVVVAGLSSLLVFWLWYPVPFNDISGGKDLFILLVSVDLVLGPFLTLLIFNKRKPVKELRVDIFLVVLMQLLALTYGLWTVFSARPVYLVHEVDRFRVISASDIDPADLPQALPQFQDLPLYGIELIGVREAKTPEEKLYSLDEALAGKDVSQRPAWWQPLGKAHMEIMRTRGRSVVSYESSDEAIYRIRRLLEEQQMLEDMVWVFPMMGRNTAWSVVVRKSDASIVGYVAVDSFE